MFTGNPAETSTWILAALAVLPLAVLPGLAVAAGLGRRAGWDLPTILCASFVMELAVTGVVSVAADVVGASLLTVAAASGAVLTVLAAASWWPGTARRTSDPGWWGLGLAMPALVLAVVERTWYSRSADAFYHMAAVRSLLVRDGATVTDPLFRTTTHVIDPTSGAWHSVLAVWSRVTGMDVATWLWPGASMITATITVLAFWALAKAASGSDVAAAAATVAWVCLGLATDLRYSAYPNRLGTTAAFVALIGFIRLARRPAWPEASLAVAGSVAAASIHMAAAAMIAAAAALLLSLVTVQAILAGPDTDAGRWRVPVFTAAAGAVAAAVAAPAVVLRAGVVESSSLVAYQTAQLSTLLQHLPGGLVVDVLGGFTRTGPALFLIGTAVALVAGFEGFRRTDAHATAVAAVVALPAALLANPIVSTPLLARSNYLMFRVVNLLPFTVFLAGAWALAPRSSRTGRIALRTLAAGLLVAAVWQYGSYIATRWTPASAISMWTVRQDDVRLRWGLPMIDRMRAEFGDRYPVVAGEPETSYHLAGILPVATVAVPIPHTPFAVEQQDGPRRRRDMAVVLDPRSDSGLRRAVLADRRAEYVVVPKTPAFLSSIAALRADPRSVTPILESRSLLLFKVVPEPAGGPVDGH